MVVNDGCAGAGTSEVTAEGNSETGKRQRHFAAKQQASIACCSAKCTDQLVSLSVSTLSCASHGTQYTFRS
jgi:hypothetical protein